MCLMKMERRLYILLRRLEAVLQLSGCWNMVLTSEQLTEKIAPHFTQLHMKAAAVVSSY